MKTKIYLIGVILCAVTMFSGCAKDGATGPAGPQGPQGNANVQSNTITIASNEWTLSGTEYTVIISDAAVTQSIISTGAIEIFASTDGATWIGLPFSIQGSELNFSYSAGQVEIAYSLDNGTTPPAPPPNGDQFKIVAIAASAMKRNPNVNLQNYNELKATFNLQD